MKSNLQKDIHFYQLLSLLPPFCRRSLTLAPPSAQRNPHYPKSILQTTKSHPPRISQTSILTSSTGKFEAFSFAPCLQKNPDIGTHISPEKPTLPPRRSFRQPKSPGKPPSHPAFPRHPFLPAPLVKLLLRSDSLQQASTGKIVPPQYASPSSPHRKVESPWPPQETRAEVVPGWRERIRKS